MTISTKLTNMMLVDSTSTLVFLDRSLDVTAGILAVLLIKP